MTSIEELTEAVERSNGGADSGRSRCGVGRGDVFEITMGFPWMLWAPVG